MYILVIGPTSTCRHLFVRNFIVRGILAVGAQKVADVQALLESNAPGLTLLCEMTAPTEDQLRQIRQHPILKQSPLVYVTTERPAAAWLKKWQVDLNIRQPLDFKRFFVKIRPLLPEEMID